MKFLVFEIWSILYFFLQDLAEIWRKKTLCIIFETNDLKQLGKILVKNVNTIIIKSDYISKIENCTKKINNNKKKLNNNKNLFVCFRCFIVEADTAKAKEKVAQHMKLIEQSMGIKLSLAILWRIREYFIIHVELDIWTSFEDDNNIRIWFKSFLLKPS